MSDGVEVIGRYLRRPSFVAGLMGLCTLVAIAILGPWLKAANHPVESVLIAPSDADLRLYFSENEFVPLVPVEEGDSPGRWATELPGRPHYDLRLGLGQSGATVQIYSIWIVGLSPEYSTQPINLSGLKEAAAAGVQVVAMEEGSWKISGEPGSWISLGSAEPVRPTGLFNGKFIFAATLWLYLGLWVALILFGLHFPWRPQFQLRAWDRKDWKIFLICGCVGTVLHLGLVNNAVTSYWPADSTSYTHKALALLLDGTYETGGQEYELNRLPGYPLFMAFVFALAGWEMDAVPIFQGIFFCAAAGIFGAVFGRILRGKWAGGALLFSLISPAGVYASCQIATESTFLSAWLLALSSWWLSWKSHGRMRWLGIVLFSLCVQAAVSIRPNGILLLALPGCLAVGAIWRAILLLISRQRVGISWSGACQVAVPFALVILLVAAWSFRNYQSRAYPAPTDLTPVTHANGPFFAGWLDIRGTHDAEMLKWMVQTRRETGYVFHGWAVRNYLFRKVTNQYQNIENRSIAELASELEGFNRLQKEQVPLELFLAALWRVGNWGLWFPDGTGYSRDAIQANLTLNGEIENDYIRDSAAANLGWATLNRNIEFTFFETETGPMLRLYNAFVVPVYLPVYRLLVLISLLSFIWFCLRARPQWQFLLMPFFLNLLLNVWFQYVIGRYIQILDSTLLFSGLFLIGYFISEFENLQREKILE